jgi:chemotaxis protein MotB
MALKAKNMISINDPRVSRIGHPAPPWLVNYADLMTELVCFFIILYALGAALSKNIKNAKEQLEQIMKDQKVQAEIKVTKDGLSLTLQEQEGFAYFESGQAELTASAISVLDKIVPVFEKIPNDIVVEGHTDGVPINTPQFASNWELSTSRATNVVKYLVKEKNMKPEKLSAVGYGEYKPIAANDNEDSKRKNRRVVFFIKK